jgi:hypothetical protein
MSFCSGAGPGEVPDGELKLAKGVTIFGSGQFVRLPSGFDAEGNCRFEPGCAVGEVDLAPLPKWLAARIRPPADDDPSDEMWVSPMAFDRYFIPFDSIAVPAGAPCNAEKVKLIAESIKVTGLPTPLTVRQLSDCWFALLSDPHQLEARKKRGMDACECIVLKVDETDGRLWQIAELLRQPKLSPLDWAELVMEWVRLVREKGARLGHPVGGPQPHDKGFSEAERVLGVSRTEMQRAEQIVGISDAAKAEIRRLNLRVKRDILKVAKLPPGEQVAIVQQLAGPKVRTVPVRGGSAPTADSESAPVPDHEPAAPLAEEPAGAEQVTEDKAEGQEGELMDSPSTTPPEIVDPPELDGEQQYVAFKARWLQCCVADFKALPAAMQARFAAELLSMAALAAGNSEGPR